MSYQSEENTKKMREIRSQVDVALKTAGYSVRYSEKKRYVSNGRVEILMVVGRVWTRAQTRYGDYNSHDPLKLRIFWQTGKYDRQQHVVLHDKFNINPLLEKIRIFFAETTRLHVERLQVEDLEEVQDSQASEIKDKHRLPDGSRIRIIPEFKKKGLRIIIAPLDYTEADELVAVLKAHMNRLA